MRLTIDQTQFALAGTFQLEFENQARNRSGTVSGNTETPSFPARLQLASSNGFDCLAGQPRESFMQLSWTRTGNTLDGSYVGFGCVGTVTGVFMVSRQ
jgi:hypothetical protein